MTPRTLRAGHESGIRRCTYAHTRNVSSSPHAINLDDQRLALSSHSPRSRRPVGRLRRVRGRGGSVQRRQGLLRPGLLLHEHERDDVEGMSVVPAPRVPRSLTVSLQPSVPAPWNDQPSLCSTISPLAPTPWRRIDSAASLGDARRADPATAMRIAATTTSAERNTSFLDPRSASSTFNPGVTDSAPTLCVRLQPSTPRPPSHHDERSDAHHS